MKNKASNFAFIKVKHNSSEYWHIVELRDKVLRKPLGLEFAKDELMAENEQFHFGLYKNKVLVGCLVLVKCSSFELKMRQVAIDPSFQSQGVGTLMINESEAWALHNGYSRMVLNARETALAFYKKKSYQIIGNSFLEVGIPHFKLFKNLTS
ncbi:MAG: GNAT family N-acetyltransferase [Bacteroidia bacterium]